MRTKQIIAFSVLTIFLSTTVAAAGEYIHADQGNAGNLDITQGELTKENILTKIIAPLDFTGVKDTYSSNEEINLEIEAETQDEYDTADAQKIVSIYKCADSTCDTPPPIDSASEDQCSNEEWWPEYDDCIAQDVDTVSFSTTQNPGTSWTWDVSFQGLEDEAQYVLVGYIRTDDQGIVTDISEKQFSVETGSTAEPAIEKDGSVKVYQTNDFVNAEIPLANTGGGDMQESDIIEMQVRPEGSGLLSLVSGQDVCDTDYPENVHKEFRLDAGDSGTITLSVNKKHLDKSQDYDIHIVTAEDCYPQNQPVPPYGGGEKVDTVSLDSGNVVLEKTDPAVQRFYTANGFVTAEIGLKNSGTTDMTQFDIVEMQVRPQGAGRLSLVTGQQVCDESYPENVHKEFRLDAGDSGTVSLSAPLDELDPGKSYDVHVLTADGCHPDNEPVPPYEGGVKLGTFELDSSGDPVENDNGDSSQEICGNGVDDDGDGEVDENCGSVLPLIPILLVTVLIAVMGGVYRRYG